MDEAKELVFALHEELTELRNKKETLGLTEKEELHLRNIEVNMMDAYSEWKDPK